MTIICPIDEHPCEGANGRKNSHGCKRRCTAASNFMDAVAGKHMKRPGAGRPSVGEQGERPALPPPVLVNVKPARKKRERVRVEKHGAAWWARKYGCTCQSCTDAKRVERAATYQRAKARLLQEADTPGTMIV